MKKFSFLALAAVGLLFGACASDTEVSDKAQDPFKGREGGFIKVGISLPVQPQVSTRAWEESATGTLDDGLNDEFKVKDCILLLFEGADESTATLKQVDNIGNAFITVKIFRYLWDNHICLIDGNVITDLQIKVLNIRHIMK